MREILDEFNRRGLRTRYGNRFERSSLAKAFRSEKYIGVLEQSGVRIEGGIPAIIDRETWDRVQRRMDLLRHSGAKNREVPVDYLLTGKVFCGHCGASMHGLSGTGRNGNKWY